MLISEMVEPAIIAVKGYSSVSLQWSFSCNVAINVNALAWMLAKLIFKEVIMFFSQKFK